MPNNRLPYLKSRRTILRKTIQTKLSEADQLLQDDQATAPEINLAIEELEDTIQKLESFTGEIIELMDTPSEAEIESEAAKIEADVSEINRIIRSLTERRRQIQPDAQSGSPDQQSQLQVQISHLQSEIDQLRTSGADTNRHPTVPSVRLPKLEVEKFDGNILKFKEFWDHFDVAIGTNSHLRRVEKLNYLRAYLTGEAKRVIAGLTATEENYDVAVSLLRERYGDVQASIDAHYSRLMELPTVPNHTTKIRDLLDQTESHLRCLQALGEDIEHRHFISLIMSKLPRDMVAHLEELKGARTAWTVDLLRTSLHNVLNAREIADRQNGSSPVVSKNETPHSSTKNRNQGHNLRSTTDTLMASEKNSAVRPQTPSATKPTTPCIFCGRSNHYYSDCRTLKTVSQRRNKVRELRRCFVCLKTGHSFSACTSTKPCFYCKQTKSHHQCLCPQKFPNKPQQSDQASVATNNNNNTREKSGAALGSPSFTSSDEDSATLAVGENVVLQTATVTLYNPALSTSVSTRVLLDSGSNRTYISKSLSKQLKLKLDGDEHFSVGTFGSDKRKRVKTSITKVLIGLKDGSKKKINVNVVEQITGSITRLPIDKDVHEFLDNNSVSSLQMADNLPSSVEKNEIGLLIGNDYYLDFVNPDRMQVKPGLYLLSSRIGWIITGRIQAESDTRDDLTMFVDSRINTVVPVQAQLLRTTFNDERSTECPVNIQDFWNLETIGIKDSPYMNDDEQALNAFNSTVKSSGDGRYQVTWPWKDEYPDLPSNYQLALGRFRSLSKKLQSDPQLFSKYREIIQEQEKLGIIEKVPPIQNQHCLKHYIPHHPVVTPTKATTKVRIVFDGSAKVNKTASSLNECLYRGPVILEDLCGLLLRFRLYTIALTADIEKAFLQVGLQDNDRDVTRFFWFQNDSLPTVDGNTQEYRFCRVPFGVVSSPFLLGATIQFHLSQCATDAYFNVSESIRNGLYVDNVITGVSSEEEALQFYQDAKMIFTKASMNLREWGSNSKTFLQQIPERDRIKDTIVKVLGIAWHTSRDQINVCTRPLDEMQTAQTKRQILKMVASFFDPLGLFAPISVKAKLLLRRISEQTKEWDTPLPQGIIHEWKHLSRELDSASNEKFQRLINPVPSETADSHYQLLCFCDASADAYAAVVYLKINSDAHSQINLVFAKTRLSPSKQTSIPKLELLAAVIAVRSVNFEESQLKLRLALKTVWTDSTCVLHWLKSTKPKPVFVENRLKEIRRSPEISFAYVKTAENAADIASRGVNLLADLKTSTWFHGPTWLLLPQDQWPIWIEPMATPHHSFEEASDGSCRRIFEIGISNRASNMEQQLVSADNPTSQSNLEPPYGIQIDNFSSLVKLYRVTAWTARFISRTRKCDAPDTCLTAAELAEAKLMWDRYIQQLNFPDVFQAISTNKSCNLKDQLNVQLDEQRILRCHGRFAYLDLPLERRCPKLLPREGHYTKLVIQAVHCRNLHSGVSHTLSQIRLEYWIPRGRSAVKRSLGGCCTCKKVQGGPYTVPQMPPYPAERVNQSSPFSYVGLDYLGPLLIKTINGHQKVWVCLFTCMAVRAVHLELVNDMSSEQFLLCLRRFIARRGKPIMILSDNAAQFKLAAKSLDRLYGKAISSSQVKDFVSQEQIAWKFIVENAPWMGGFYERLVGSVKGALKKSIGRLLLSFDQLHTCLLEVEAVVNQRPLTYSGDTLKDIAVLTPQHFLTLNPRILHRPTSQEESPNVGSTAGELLASWKRGRAYLNQFWHAWTTDYLNSLRERAEVKLRQPRVKAKYSPGIDDVVLVKENFTHRGKWTIARICECFTSKDGKVRSVKLLMPGGRYLQRPIKLLYPFELARTNHSAKTSSPSPTSPPSLITKPGADALARPSIPDQSSSASTVPPEVEQQDSPSQRLPRQAKDKAMNRIRQSSTAAARCS